MSDTMTISVPVGPVVKAYDFASLKFNKVANYASRVAGKVSNYIDENFSLEKAPGRCVLISSVLNNSLLTIVGLHPITVASTIFTGCVVDRILENHKDVGHLTKQEKKETLLARTNLIGGGVIALASLVFGLPSFAPLAAFTALNTLRSIVGIQIVRHGPLHEVVRSR